MAFFPFSVAVGGVVPMDVNASFIRYESVTAGADNPRIRVRGVNLDEVLRPGQWFKVPRVVEKFRIENYDGVASITGLLIYSGKGEEFGSGRVDGDVSVIDGARSVSVADKAFSGSYYQAGGAASYAAVQLWNPSNSGKRLVVWDYWAWCDSSSYGQSVGRYLTQLASNNGVLVSHAFRASANASSVAQLRNEQLSALPAAADFKKISNPTQISYTEQLHVMKFPVIVFPGVGLTFIGDYVNKAIKIRVSFREEDDN